MLDLFAGFCRWGGSKFIMIFGYLYIYLGAYDAGLQTHVSLGMYYYVVHLK